MKGDDLTEDQKHKFWVDYMVTQVALNVDLKRSGAYPKSVGLHPIKGIEEFCKLNQDDRGPENINGWYWRFKNRVKI